MGKYIIEYNDIVVQSHISKLSKSVKEVIKSVIEKKLAVDPVKFGKPLQYSFAKYVKRRDQFLLFNHYDRRNIATTR